MVLLGFIYYFIFLTLYIVNVVGKQHVYIILIEKKNILKQHGVEEQHKDKFITKENLGKMLWIAANTWQQVELF